LGKRHKLKKMNMRFWKIIYIGLSGKARRKEPKRKT
jgi:hypothetical protein